MYQVVIADDEFLFRKKLKEMVDWESLGFTVAASFGSGEQALAFVREHPVDVMFTDIRMTPVSGLELAKELHDHHPHVKVVLISGYSEFRYAQAAIKYGVTDYLIKPVGRATISDTLLRIKEDWELARGNEFSYLAVRQAFLDLVSGGRPDVIREQLADAGVQLDCVQARYVLSRIEILDFEAYLSRYSYGREGFYHSLCQLVPRMDSGVYYSVLHIAGNQFVILAAAQLAGTVDLKACVQSTLSRCVMDIKTILKADAQMKVGEPAASVVKLQQAYRQQTGEEPLPAVEAAEDSLGPIERAEQYIKKNYWKDICQEEVADYVGLSVYYFSRLFKSITHEKFVDYMVGVRMEKARELLMESSIKVSDIAPRVGYANYSTFHRIFKASFGCAPGEYRAAHGKGGEQK